LIPLAFPIAFHYTFVVVNHVVDLDHE